MDVPITAYTVVAPGLDFEPIFARNAWCKTAEGLLSYDAEFSVRGRMLHVSSMVHGVATPSALLPQQKHNTCPGGGGGGTGRGFGTQKTGDDPNSNLSALI